MSDVPALEARGDTGTPPHAWNPVIEKKTAYAVQRIQLNDWPDGDFREDREAQGENPVGFHIYGPCPACKALTSALCAAEYLQDDQDLVTNAEDPERAERADRKGSTTIVTVLRCSCLEEHAGAPAGASGCGTEWLLRVNYFRDEHDNTVLLHPVKADEAFRYWLPAEDVTSAIPAALAAVQATAGKWQTALAALIAVLGISVVLSGGSTIAALDATWKILLAVAAAVAVISNLIMLYYSDLASLGFPGLRGARQKRSLINADLEPLTQVAATVKEIRIARSATAVALLGAIAAAGIFLFVSPAAPKAESKLTLEIPQSGTRTIPQTTGCGTVTIVRKPAAYAEFTRDAKGTTQISYPLSEVTAIDAR
jgi:hypothetical protein